MKKNGFTLIELIVATGIILLLGAIIFPNFNLGKQNLALERSASKLVQDLSRAREMAMSAKKESLCYDLYPRLKGYGIYFNDYYLENTYFYSFSAKCQDDSEQEDISEIERIKLEKGIRIKELIGDGTPTYVINIFFYPPDPETDLQKWLSGGFSAANEVKIILALESDLTKTKTIKVNKAGLINVE